MLHPLLHALHIERFIFNQFQNKNLLTPSCYTLDDAIQIMQYMLRQREIDAAHVKLATEHGAANRPTDPAAFRQEIELVIVEPNTKVRIDFRGDTLIRTEVIKLSDPLAKINDTMARARSAWYHQGLMRLNEAVREASAATLLAAISEETPQSDLVRAVITEARGKARNFEGLVEGLATLRDMFAASMVVTTHINQYLSDGRALPWPPELPEETMEAAKRLALPCFHPAAVINQDNVGVVMTPDGGHYTQYGAKMMAGQMRGFIESSLESAGLCILA